MLPHLGFFLLLTCCILCVYSCFASILAAYWRHVRLFRSARWAATTVSVLALIASILMWYMLFNRMFEVNYIAKNSSTDLPAFYTFTVFWSSLEGSHMFWTLLLSFCGTIGIWTAHKDNDHILPYVNATICAVLGWMFYLAITHSDFFKMTLPPPPNGNGLNALLQNFYMSIHPPLLFIGYTTTAVPFGYAIAALCYGDVTQGWLRSVRRWALVSWTFLTVSITLGGKWAYVELGWAGYWAWDPVENASFMPWLMMTALLHSLYIQEKIGHLKRLSIILAILAFFMTFLGTFITRSGVIASVHSFAESPIGPSYLIFISSLLVGSILLFAVRSHSILPSEIDKVWGMSKESALIVTQFILISFAAIILVGTLFPIISEALSGQKISIQAPYFNAFAPYFGAATVFMISVGNLMKFHRDDMKENKKIILMSCIYAIPMSGVLFWLGDVHNMTRGLHSYIMQTIGIYLLCWSLSCLTWDFTKRLSKFQYKWKPFLKFNMAYTGAFLAHIGLLAAIFGFLGNYRGLEKTVTLKPGESTELYGMEFKLKERVKIEQVQNVTLFVAPIEVTKNGKKFAEVRPAQARYPTTTETMNEIGVHSRFWKDLYIVLASFDTPDRKHATLNIHVNPTVKIVWIGIAIMTLGGLFSTFDRRRGRRSQDVLTGGTT